MSSGEEKKAEGAAREAVPEQADVNKQREHEAEQQQKTGVFGTLQEGTMNFLMAAKEAVVGKAHDASESTGEGSKVAADKTSGATDTAAGKAKETKDSATEKLKETKDTTLSKVIEYKDSAAEKASETKDCTADKTKEGKDTTVGKITELNETAADAARRGMDILSGKNDEVQQKSSETSEAAKGKLRGTEEWAKQKLGESMKKLEELELKVKGDKDGGGHKAEETREVETEKGNEKKGNILEAIGGVKEEIKEKLGGFMEYGAGGKREEEKVTEGSRGQ